GLDELAERGRIVHGHVGQHLPGDLDPGLAQAVHEPRIGQAVLARAPPPPGDPQAAELGLAVSSVTVGVLSRVEELFLGHAVALRSRSEVPLRLAEHLTALLLRVDRSFDPCHLRYFPRSRRMLVRSAVPWVMPSTRRRRLPLFFRRKWLPVALRWRILPVRVMRKRLAVARCVFCLGIALLPLVERLPRPTPLYVSWYVSGGASAGAATTSSGACSGTGSSAARAPPRPGQRPPPAPAGSSARRSSVRGASSTAPGPSPCCVRPAWDAPRRPPDPRGQPPADPRSCGRARSGPSRDPGT